MPADLVDVEGVAHEAGGGGVAELLQQALRVGEAVDLDHGAPHLPHRQTHLAIGECHI